MVVPAILSQSVADFKEKLGRVRGFPELSAVHVDFADGRFVKNKTLLPAQISALPMDYVFSAHLMVERPQEYVEAAQKAGFESVAFHFEALTHERELSQLVRQIQDWGMRPQLAFNPQTDIRKIKPFLQEVDTLLVMGVDPGFYGSDFKEETADRVASLREGGFYGTIIVDGGIKKENAKLLLASGADYLVIGSAIFKQRDPKESYLELYQSTLSA
jgi:ribulose-phosphate 3-epimerase